MTSLCGLRMQVHYDLCATHLKVMNKVRLVRWLVCIYTCLSIVQDGTKDLFVLDYFFIYEQTVVWTMKKAEQATGKGSRMIGITDEFIKNTYRKLAGFDQCDETS